jgi:phosphohistidine phosphatase
MKTLILMRHAKSDWGNPSLPDHDRPLNARGRRDGPLMAQRLQKSVAHIDCVWVSSAVRTQETWAFLQPTLTIPEQLVVTEPGVYEATAAELLALLLRAPASVQNLLVIGHAPGLPSLTALVTGSPMLDFPTAAFAVLDFAINQWAELAPGCATLRDYAYPKDAL